MSGWVEDWCLPGGWKYLQELPRKQWPWREKSLHTSGPWSCPWPPWNLGLAGRATPACWMDDFCSANTSLRVSIILSLTFSSASALALRLVSSLNFLRLSSSFWFRLFTCLFLSLSSFLILGLSLFLFCLASSYIAMVSGPMENIVIPIH